MAFNKAYRHTLDRDGKGKKGAKSCILPFFGFDYGSDTDSYSQGVYISDSTAPGGQRKVYGTHSLDVEVFSRNNPPTGKALELEEKFIRLVPKSSDPWSLPYIQKSASDYYDDVLKPAPAASIGCVLGIILTILWFVFYKHTFKPIEAKFGYDTGCVIFVFVAPIVINVALLVIGAIIDGIKKACNKAPREYFELTWEEREEVKQKYFDKMRQLYGEEVGEVLKEYAILKGYVR